MFLLLWSLFTTGMIRLGWTLLTESVPLTLSAAGVNSASAGVLSAQMVCTLTFKRLLLPAVSCSAANTS